MNESLHFVGCNTGECDTDFIAAGLNMSPLADVFNHQTRTSSWNTETRMTDVQADSDLMTCHSVIDEECDVNELGANAGEEFEEFVTWTCPDGPGPGKTCTKGGSDPFYVGGKKRTKICECEKTCAWRRTWLLPTPGTLGRSS